MKDVKNHAMASESHNPAAPVLVVSLKCVLHVAVRLPIAVGPECSGAGTRDYNQWCTLNIMDNIKICCTADAMSKGSPHLTISSS